MGRILLLLAALLAPAGALAGMPVTAVALHGRDQHGLRALLARQRDPRSADYARWLSPSEFGRRFGARGPDVRRASRWLRAHGCRVHRFASRQLLGCTGARLAGVPPALAALIADLVGPDGPSRVTHLPPGDLHPLGTVNGIFFFTPDEFARVYNLTPIRAAGIDGTGQRIGILGFTTIDPADVNTFRGLFDLPPLALEQVGRVRFPGTRAEVEALLDVTWSGAVAPGAAITLVAVPPTGAAIAQGLARLVNDPGVAIISLSVGFDRGKGAGALTRQVYRLFRQAAAQGQTVLAASGDSGSYVSKGRRVVRGTDPVPSSPFVTAVGGTTPAPERDDAGNATGYGSEAVWTTDAGAASGGGVSPVARPSYQRGRRRRTIPDVAFPAAPMFPFVEGGQRLCCVGGTSAATPAWAGVVALLNQQRGQRAGFLNPALYRLGRAQQGGGPTVFHDVTNGTNGLYPATPGYDLATGWGSIDGQAFFAAFPGGP